MASSDGSFPDENTLQELHEATPQHQRGFILQENRDNLSRQLLFEFGEQNLKYIRELQHRLDQHTFDQEQAHRQALILAAREHERVRETAERAQLRLQHEVEEERLIREEEERQALDRARQDRIDRELANRKRAFEDAQRLEEHKRAAEKEAEEAKLQYQAAERRRAEQDERDRAIKQLAEQETKDKRAEEQRARETQAQRAIGESHGNTPHANPGGVDGSSKITKSVLTSNPSPLISSIESKESQHQEYLTLHQRLKEMRKFVVTESKRIPELKSQIGDMRRGMKKAVGQLNFEKDTNKIPMKTIMDTLMKAQQYRQSMIDPRPFIVRKTPSKAQSQDLQMPALFVYVLNIFAKAVISQFLTEAAVLIDRANPFGLAAVSIFGRPEFCWQGTSFIDILIAKFHVVCPVLFGINGSETTERGRSRLGWWKDPETNSWVSEQRHSERMSGLGAGYAAVSLRNFAKSKISNPYPATHYWSAVANIINTPTEQITQTHLLVLKAMLGADFVPKFIGFFGQAAVAALKKAVIDLPQQLPKSVGADALSTVAALLRRDLYLAL